MAPVFHTVVPAEQVFESTIDNGCLLTDSESYYLDLHLRPPMAPERLVAEDLNPIAVDRLGGHPFITLHNMGIDISLMQEAAQYTCPYLCMHFFAVVPTYLLTKNLRQYDRLEDRFTQDQMNNDAEWNRNWYSGHQTEFKCMGDHLMGPGYTDGFLKSDGSNGYKAASVLLSNGDYLTVKLYYWYNK